VARGGFGAKAPPLAASPVVGSVPPKTEHPNLCGFELHRPSIKGTKELFQVIKAIIIIGL